jgi:tRNA (guanine26-N2/guanine27-N2)-dimethyltransferase
MASEIWSHNLPKAKVISALSSLGYSIVQTYYNPELFKTDAPIPVVYDLMKLWKQKLFEKGVEKGDYTSKNMKENSLATRIMAKPATIEPDFELKISDLKIKQKGRS